jgi:hypothetical protein
MSDIQIEDAFTLKVLRRFNEMVTPAAQVCDDSHALTKIQISLTLGANHPPRVLKTSRAHPMDLAMRVA